MDYCIFDPHSEYSIMCALLNAGFSAKQAHDAVCALFPPEEETDWEDDYVWVPSESDCEWDDHSSPSVFDTYEPTLEEWKFYRDNVLGRSGRNDKSDFEQAMEWCDIQEAIEDDRNHEWERYS